jgi:hypothetical protein
MKKDKMKSQDFDSKPDFTITIDVFPNGVRNTIESIDKDYKIDHMRILGAVEYFKQITISNQHKRNVDSIWTKQLDSIYERVSKLEEKL